MMRSNEAKTDGTSTNRLSPWATEIAEGNAPPPTMIVIDVSYLAYRTFFAMGNLEFDSIATTIAFGIFREIQILSELFLTETFAFCFDVGKPFRCNFYSEYKKSRKTEDPEKLQQKQEVRDQINMLREEWLPRAGFSNLFWAHGFEADDLIASLCLNKIPGQEVIIVSSDTDLYQLLTDKIMVWSPSSKKMMTVDRFRKTYGVYPVGWADVKAIAGCVSDNIRGIEKVGEKTAAKYLRGELKPGSAAFNKIVSGGALWEQNLRLVRLPFDGTPVFQAQAEEFDRIAINRVLTKLGIESLEM